MSKYLIKIKDNCTSHSPSSIQNSDIITYERNITDFSGYIEINDGDVVIYTNNFLDKIVPNTKLNIAFLFENKEITPNDFDYISKNNKNCDLVLTHDKSLLDRGENFKLNPYGTCWMHDDYINIWDKSKLCSMIMSDKNWTSGHRLRHTILDMIKDNDFNSIDMYGGKFNNLPFVTANAFHPECSVRDISNKKINGLKDYQFSIVIENTKEDYYFTEKLIDCFLTGTVPIYYGCPSIGEFFDTKGILAFTTIEECKEILDNLTSNLYESIKPHIEINFQKAQKYKNVIIEEKYILELL